MKTRFNWASHYTLHPSVKHAEEQNAFMLKDALDAEAVKNYISEFKFDSARRLRLHSVISQQINSLSNLPAAVINNLNLLKQDTTFTVACGHQLVLWTGPLFVWTKIAHTISLCKQLKQQFPKYNFIPVYWLASEDHDYKEIQSVHLNQKQYQWSVTSEGPVGCIKPNSALRELSQNLFDSIKEFPHAASFCSLIKLFEESNNLSEAIQKVLYALFGSEGLICLDANCKELKTSFKNILKGDVLHSETLTAAATTMRSWTENRWKPVIGFRACNMFYLHEGTRKRLDVCTNGLCLSDQSEVWKREEMEQLIEDAPERFSPNALLRPVYQQYVLPNLVYVAGPQEKAYWLQLPSVMKHYQVFFPLLPIRYMIVPVRSKDERITQKLGLNFTDWFKPESELVQDIFKSQSQALNTQEILNRFKSQILPLGAPLYEIEGSLKSAFEAETQKYLNRIEHFAEKSNSHRKNKNTELKERVFEVLNSIMPQHRVNERTEHGGTWYLHYGPEFIKLLIETCEHFNGEIVFKTFNTLKS